MQEFFAEKQIEITGDSGKAITFYMRPLIVDELPKLFRIKEMQAQRKHAFGNVLDLVGSTIDIEIDDLPCEALEGLIDTFIKFNFGKPETGKTPPAGTKKARQEVTMSDCAMVMEAMINQGHALSEIKKYTLPQFMAIQDAIANRLSGNTKKSKPKSLQDAFADFGIPAHP